MQRSWMRLPILPCGRGLRSSGTRSSRAISRRRRRSAPCTGPRSRNGGRSSRPQMSKRSKGCAHQPQNKTEEEPMRHPSRARFLGGVCIIVSLNIMSAASADTALTVGKASPNASAIIPVNVGDKLGIFAKRGLDLKISDFTGGSKLAQAMTAGSIEIGVGAGTEMALVAKGAPLLAVCNAAPSIPFIGMAVPWDSPIKTVGQLRGSKIGVSSAGSLTEWLALELARHEGWGANAVTPVAIGNAAASIVAAFREHLVDADVAVTSLIFDMEEKQIGRLLIPVSNYVGNLA